MQNDDPHPAEGGTYIVENGVRRLVDGSRTAPPAAQDKPGKAPAGEDETQPPPRAPRATGKPKE